jgi:hypothetical protein
VGGWLRPRRQASSTCSLSHSQSTRCCLVSRYESSSTPFGVRARQLVSPSCVMLIPCVRAVILSELQDLSLVMHQPRRPVERALASVYLQWPAPKRRRRRVGSAAVFSVAVAVAFGVAVLGVGLLRGRLRLGLGLAVGVAVGLRGHRRGHRRHGRGRRRRGHVGLRRRDRGVIGGRVAGGRREVPAGGCASARGVVAVVVVGWVGGQEGREEGGVHGRQLAHGEGQPEPQRRQHVQHRRPPKRRQLPEGVPAVPARAGRKPAAATGAARAGARAEAEGRGIGEGQGARGPASGAAPRARDAGRHPQTLPLTAPRAPTDITHHTPHTTDRKSAHQQQHQRKGTASECGGPPSKRGCGCGGLTCRWRCSAGSTLCTGRPSRRTRSSSIGRRSARRRRKRPGCPQRPARQAGARCCQCKCGGSVA